jgi:hypothetical protein
MASLGYEIVLGDISTAASIRDAIASVAAVYISIQTLIPQHNGTAGLYL